MLLNLLFCSLLAWATTALAATVGPLGTISVSNRVIAPDGFERSASVVNGGNPAPAIIARKGDRVRINVINHLTDKNQILGTTIHWHGIFQTGTNFMDGVEGVTQCPIAPFDSFLYDFHVNQAGTYWYHSHFGVQYCDGVRGPLVIYDPLDPLKVFYDVDDESTIITLSEWYHKLAVDLLNAPAIANSTLINGLGRYPGGVNSNLAVVNVVAGKRYRLRLVSISCDPNFVFSIDGHNLVVIEADGVSLRPETVDSIQIFAAQRYSAVLHANQPVDNYWIRALPNSGAGNLSSTFENGVNSAILRYRGAKIQEPASKQRPPLTDPLVEGNLHPLLPMPVPGAPRPDGADKTFNLTFDFNELGNFTINGVAYKPPTVPVLLQILSGRRDANDLLPEGSVYPVPRNRTIQVDMQSYRAGPHPFHLHGHNFHVIRSADTGKYNFGNPVVRDTVSLGDTKGDQVSIRFRTDNPGPWIFHCHIEFHLAAGFAIVFAEAPDDVANANPDIPDEWDELCPTWDSEPDSIRHAGNV